MLTSHVVSALVGAALLSGLPQLHAQPPARRSGALSRPQVCDMRASILILRVVDRRTGAPVSRATIVATRSRTHERLADAAWMGTPGNYLLAGDGDLPGLTRDGETVDVVISLGARRVRTRVEVGLTADGCHVELRNAPKEIRL